MNMKIIFEFMVEMDLPVPFDDEFLSMIPSQRALVNKLINEGIITSKKPLKIPLATDDGTAHHGADLRL